MNTKEFAKRRKKLARAIEGSPNDVLGKIDRFFNRPASVSGDSAKKGLDLIERTEIEGRDHSAPACELHRLDDETFSSCG